MSVAQVTTSGRTRQVRSRNCKTPVGERHQVGYGGLRVLRVARRIGLAALDAEVQRQTTGAGTRDGARVVIEHDAQVLAFRPAAGFQLWVAMPHQASKTARR